MANSTQKKKLAKLLGTLDPSFDPSVFSGLLTEIEKLKGTIPSEVDLTPVYETIKTLVDQFTSQSEVVTSFVEGLNLVKKELETKITAKDLTSISESLTSFKKTSNSDLESLKKDITQRLNNLGGGAAHRRITNNGTELSTRYADINLIGSGVTLTAADDTIKKRVNLTFTASGGGAVSSVSNSDGTLTISPTTGGVVSSINLNHANTWLTTQTFATTIGFTANNAIISLPSNLQIISAFNTGGMFRVGNSDGALKVDMELWTMKFQNTSGFRVLDLDAGAYRAIIGDFDGQNSGNYIDTDDSSAITIYGVGGLINFPGQDMYFESFFGGSWINMSTNGPSGLGSGGAGATAWIAYANSAGNWFPNATAGDVVYRSTSNTTRLLFGNDGLLNAPMVLYGNNLSLNGANATANLHLAASTTTRASLRIPAGTAPTSPNEGDMWADSTQKALQMFNDGVVQVASSVLFTQTADATVTNTVTETSILGTGVGTKTLPANFFVAGKTIRIRVGGIYSTPALGATATIKVKYGATVLATKATTSLFGGASGLEFDGEVLITCRTTGSSGTVMTHGDIEYATGVTGTIAVDPLNNGGATTTINTTTSNALDITVTWDSNTTTRIATSTISTIEVLN